MAKATRQAFGEYLAKLGEIHPEIVVFDADLAKATKSDVFAKKFPKRFFEMGIAEMNMVGAATGMSFMGKVPFLCSFGCFLTGRYDTIRMSAVYAQANVRLIGTHAGLGIGQDGYSQMGLEDVSLMRSLPTMGVFQPMDARETELVMDYLVKEWKGPAYLRLTRQNLPDLFPTDSNSKFDPLKLLCLKKADRRPKITLIGTGAGTAEAMTAAKILESNPDFAGQVEVFNALALKPFDEETVARLAKDTSIIATIEDHSVIGGLGTCIAEVLAKVDGRAKLVKFGLQDLFGESGDGPDLFDKYGFSGAKVAEALIKKL